MKALLTAVKGRLEGNLAYLKGLHILGVDENFPPESATPALGIRDGGTVPSVHDTEQIFEELTVDVDIFVENLRDVEAPVMGDPLVKGLLDIAADVRAQLNDQLFTAPPDNLDFQDAYVTREAPPILFIFPEAGKEILKKTLTFVYRRLRAR